MLIHYFSHQRRAIAPIAKAQTSPESSSETAVISGDQLFPSKKFVTTNIASLRVDVTFEK